MRAPAVTARRGPRVPSLRRCLAVIAIPSVLCVACRHASDTATPRPPEPPVEEDPVAISVVPPELVGTSWRLVRIDDRELDPDLPDVTVNFEPTRMSGSGGCNRFTAWLDGGTGDPFVISHLAVTSQDCVHPRIMDREARYLTALESLVGYRLSAGGLELTHAWAGEEGRLVFEAASGR